MVFTCTLWNQRKFWLWLHSYNIYLMPHCAYFSIFYGHPLNTLNYFGVCAAEHKKWLATISLHSLHIRFSLECIQLFIGNNISIRRTMDTIEQHSLRGEKKIPGTQYVLQLMRTNSWHVTRIDAFISNCIRNSLERFSFLSACFWEHERKTFIPSRMLHFLAVYYRPEAILHCCVQFNAQFIAWYSMFDSFTYIYCWDCRRYTTKSSHFIFCPFFTQFLRYNLMEIWNQQRNSR